MTGFTSINLTWNNRYKSKPNNHNLYIWYESYGMQKRQLWFVTHDQFNHICQTVKQVSLNRQRFQSQINEKSAQLRSSSINLGGFFPDFTRGSHNRFLMLPLNSESCFKTLPWNISISECSISAILTLKTTSQNSGRLNLNSGISRRVMKIRGNVTLLILV